MELEIKLTKTEAFYTLEALSRFSAFLTSKAWDDLEAEYLEKSDEVLEIYKKIAKEFTK